MYELRPSSPLTSPVVWLLSVVTFGMTYNWGSQDSNYDDDDHDSYNNDVTDDKDDDNNDSISDGGLGDDSDDGESDDGDDDDGDNDDDDDSDDDDISIDSGNYLARISNGFVLVVTIGGCGRIWGLESWYLIWWWRWL